jgi:hypothetical protein
MYPGRASMGVPKPRSLNKIQPQQGINEDPSAWLERIYQTYIQYTGLDPEAPENVWMAI